MVETAVNEACDIEKRDGRSNTPNTPGSVGHKEDWSHWGQVTLVKSSCRDLV